MEFVLDVQGFKANDNTFVFKELALSTLEEDCPPQVYLFRPPFDWNVLRNREKSSNRWLELNYHGIPWCTGDISQKEVQGILHKELKNATKVYVKGREKIQWLKNVSVPVPM